MTLIEQLEKIKEEIFREANGVTCSECVHAILDPEGVGCCNKHKNIITGKPLNITAPAPRCKHGFLSKIKDSVL